MPHSNQLLFLPKCFSLQAIILLVLFHAGTEEFSVGSSLHCILAWKCSTFAVPRKPQHLSIDFPDQVHAPGFLINVVPLQLHLDSDRTSTCHHRTQKVQPSAIVCYTKRCSQTLPMNIHCRFSRKPFHRGGLRLWLLLEEPQTKCTSLPTRLETSGYTRLDTARILKACRQFREP